MQNSMAVFTFSILGEKHPFQANLVKKIKCFSLSWNPVLELKLFIWRNLNMPISMVVFTFSTFDGKHFVQKIKIVSLSWNPVLWLKLATKPNSNMQISIVVFTCSILDGKDSFFGKFGSKNQKKIFTLKFSTYPNSNIQIWMVVFTLSIFDRKHPFWANLIKEIKIVTLIWNLVICLKLGT